MARPVRANVFAGGYAGDPSVPPGVAAPVGALLPRLGTTELWQKHGAADTDWAIMSVVSGIHQEVAAIDQPTTISLVPVPLPAMSMVVAVAGTYLCLYNGVGHNQNSSGYVYYRFHRNGALVPTSERHLQSNNDKAAVLVQVIALAAGDTLDVYWYVDGNTGVMHDRNLTIVRIA